MSVTDFNLTVANYVQADTGASLTLKGAVADGGSAIAAIIDNSVTLSNATAKLLSIKNNGTERLYLDKDGVLNITSALSAVPVIKTPATTGIQIGNIGISTDVTGNILTTSGHLSLSVYNLFFTTGQISFNSGQTFIDKFGLDTPLVKGSGYTGGAIELRSEATNSGPIINTSSTIVANPLLTIQNNTVDKAVFNQDGALTISGVASSANAVTVPAQSRMDFSTTGDTYIYGDVGGHIATGAGGGFICNTTALVDGAVVNFSGTMINQGRPTDAGGAIGSQIGSWRNLTFSSAKVLDIVNNNTTIAYIDKDGNFFPASSLSASLGSTSIRWSNIAGNVLDGNETHSSVYKNGNSGTTRLIFSNTGYNEYDGEQADGASAIGHLFNTTVAYANATAKLVSIKNNSVEKAYIDKDGNYFTTGDISAKLFGQPLWRATLSTTSGNPIDNTTIGSPYVLTAGQVVLLQSDVSTYVEIVAAGSMTAGGGKSIVLEPNEKFYYQVKQGAEKVSVDCPSGSVNCKVFTLEV